MATVFSTSPIMAAEFVYIDGQGYDTSGVRKTYTEGGTWSWTDADNLDLHNYRGGWIGIKGKINLNDEGTNNMAQIFSDDLTINSVKNETLNIVTDSAYSDGIFAVGDVTVEGCNLNITASNDD